MNRVVVTGMGVVSPIGNNVKEFWDSALKGVCGVDKITKADYEGTGVSLAAEVKNFNPLDTLTKKEIRRFDDFSIYGLVATDQAIKDSKLDGADVDPFDIGIMYGSGIGGFNTNEKEFRNLFDKGPRKVSTLFIPTAIINAVAANIAIKYDARNKCSSEVTACATGTDNIGAAFRQIRNGYAKVVICGGSEASINKLAIAGFANMRALSTSEDPNRASIPFDEGRNGFVMGEGAATLILEEYEHAKSRGAHIYAEVVGYGSTCDAYHITSPHPEGKIAAVAVENAIKEAGIDKSEVGYINAHGTSTPYNDLFETRIIKNVFGDYAKKIPVSSTKSMTGHMLGAGGAVEAVASIMTLTSGYAHRNVNLVSSEEELDLDYIKDENRKIDKDYVISNSFGFGGHNGVLIFKRVSE